MSDSLSVCVVIPVHNRRETTLRCLRHLWADGIERWAKIVVVDDGSTDGTRDAILSEFPAINLLSGDGDLWWGGAIRKGMEDAFHQGAEFIVWLNDDTLPRPGVLNELVSLSRTRNSIVTGATVVNETFAFGGQLQTLTGFVDIPHFPPELIECDTFGGNMVCIPRNVIELVGFVRDDLFPHGSGDRDYGLLAKRNGILILYARDLVADTIAHDRPDVDSFFAGKTPLFALWRRVFRVGQGLYWRSNWWLYVRNWGLWGVLLFLKLYLRLGLLSLARLVLPASFRERIASRYSAAYRFKTHSSK